MYKTKDKPRLYTPINPGFHLNEGEKVARFEATLPDEYWEYRRKWVDNPKNHIVGDFPINVDFEITNLCNLKCTMCPRTDSVNRGSFWKIGFMDIDDYKNVIDEGIRYGLCAVKYNFMGEPLLHPDLVEMIKYAKNAGVLDVMFNTNAVLLTEEISRDLILSGLDKIFFSFDSPYKDKYESIRVGAKYEEVLHNIIRFHKIRGDRIKPFTRVNMVLMKENQKEWEDFKKLFEPIVDGVSYGNFLSHVGMDRENDVLLNERDTDVKYCCSQIWQRMIIHPDGVVTPCCVNSDRSLIMGNIFEESVHEIWTGKRYKELRDLHASGNYDKVQACKVCPYSHYEGLG